MLFSLNMFWQSYLSPWHYLYQETEGLYLIIRENNNIYFFYFVGQTESSFEIFEQEALHITTFDHLGIAKFCPKQEIIDQALYYYSDLTLSHSFQPMGAQNSMTAVLPPAKSLAIASCRSSNTGPSTSAWMQATTHFTATLKKHFFSDTETMNMPAIDNVISLQVLMQKTKNHYLP